MKGCKPLEQSPASGAGEEIMTVQSYLVEPGQLSPSSQEPGGSCRHPEAERRTWDPESQGHGSAPLSVGLVVR